MIIRISKIISCLFLLVKCNPKLVDDPIPLAFFNEITINLSFPDYAALNRNGGFAEITDNNAGVRGIILYRETKNIYLAYEKNCSYRPNEACATVDIHSSGLFMIDSCCGSTFEFKNGTPTGGSAWRPLRRYKTQLDGSILTISDEVIE